jgi:hypothetical protein
MSHEMEEKVKGEKPHENDKPIKKPGDGGVTTEEGPNDPNVPAPPPPKP